MKTPKSVRHIVILLSLTALVLLIALCGLTWFLFEKQKNLMAGEENAQTTRQNALVRAQEKALLDRTENERELLSSYFIKGEVGTAALLETVEMLARDRDLSLNETVSTDKTGSTTRTLVLNVEAKGSFQNTISYLAALESLPHEVVFRSVTMRRSSELGGAAVPWTLSVVLAISSFEP